MRIYLIGMPGSGKSTLGISLANLMNYSFIDLDERIIEMEQMPISEVFSQKGEGYFRQVEQQALQNTFTEENIIVATGGGTPCFFDNMEKINHNGISIFLNIPLNQLVVRLLPGKNKKQLRPLFTGKNKEQIIESLQAMWDKRLPYYQKAQIQLSLEDTKPERISSLIQRKTLPF